MQRVSESSVYPMPHDVPTTTNAANDMDGTSSSSRPRHISFASSLPQLPPHNSVSPQEREAQHHPSSPPLLARAHNDDKEGNSLPDLPVNGSSGVATEACAVPGRNRRDTTTSFVETGYSLRGARAAAEPDLAHGAILIYPKKIDNLRRFRILFVGVLLFISSSAQGMHSLFGTLYLQTVYRFSVREMAVVYLCGQAAGMFVFPFGALYDWFGPRVVVAAGSVVAALGHLLFALAFSGHIAVTVPNCAVFYAVMCWGCYALDVTVLPAVLSHMPRDRGQPTGLLETFSGLGSSFFSCLFRGFFGNNFANLMWFLFAVTVAAGAAGTWYLEDAPYVVNRWQQRRITPREQLRKYLIRNRYMSQLVPRRRYMMLSVVLMLLNFYLTIQTVVVAYLASEMTDGKRRGIAVGAIVIVLLILILVVPVDAIDGPTEQDKQVIEAAKAKEEELHQIEKKHRKQRSERSSDAVQDRMGEHEENALLNASVLRRRSSAEVRVGTSGEAETVGDCGRNTAAHEVLSLSDSSHPSNDVEQVTKSHTAPTPHPSPATVEEEVPLSTHRHRPHHSADDGGVLTQRMGLPLYKPAAREVSLISVDLDDVEEARQETPSPSAPHTPMWSSTRRRTSERQRLSLSLTASKRLHGVPVTAGAVSAPAAAASAAAPQGRELSGNLELMQNASFTLHIDERGNVVVDNATALQRSRRESDAEGRDHYQMNPLTSENPHVQVITLCGEVYVAPVYQTTFFESLTYLDTWLIFYVTMCVWGVGLTMVGNWNIYIMLLARYGGMEQKHYILFAAMAGVSTAGGRVFLGMYERILQILRERTGIIVVPTLLYPITSVGLLIGTILWIALPGDKVLVLAYLIGPAFYGISSSITPYVLGTIFDRDLGMHYGFCFLAGAIGFVLCYWCSWYLTYREETVLTPRGYLCVGQRRCMNRAVGIYVALVFSSIFPAYVLHRRYSKLVAGKLTQKRVIVPHLRRMFQCCGCGSDKEVVEGRRVLSETQPSRNNPLAPPEETQA